ncbi:HD domain-containing phosphohydrolase [Imbroritus primus]|uniref:HD domain-containing phosphohydrolase n=1 Tax=Imbroritus primus TaxID=3058603 RepID=UPI003D1623A3
MNGKSRGISLKSLIAWAIIAGVALLGGTLTWRSYSGMQNIVLSAAEDYAEQLGVIVNERAERILEPAQQTIRILALDPVANATDMTARLARLPVLAQLLNSNAMWSAVYAGFDNGDFLLLRRLGTTPARTRVNAPADSAYLLQTITNNATGGRQGHWRFYDAELRLLREDLKPDYDFDPRTRAWYTHTAKMVLTDPYTFFTTGEAGVTLAQRSARNNGVIGLDVSVADLSARMDDLQMTPGTQLAVVDEQGLVIAHHHGNPVAGGDGPLHLKALAETDQSALAAILAQGIAAQPTHYSSAGAEWYGMKVPLSRLGQQEINLLIAVPAAEMLAEGRKVLVNEILWIAILTPVMLLIGLVLGRRLGRPLDQLAQQVQELSGFDFSKPVGVRSHVREVQTLSDVLGRMSRTIRDFEAITLTLNQEIRLDATLNEVLQRLVSISGVASGAVYLLPDTGASLQLASASATDRYPEEVACTSQDADEAVAAVRTALGNHPGYLVLSLSGRAQNLLGVLVLQLAAEHNITPRFEKAFHNFVSDLSGALAVAIETRQLLENQKRLLDAIIKLLAGAIDAKSPYTAGHCERVPELAHLLLNRVIEAKTGPFADFSMTDAELDEFRIAAWLHDCGKITSPDFIVDKATKLETLYNRIHEIRTRFEVLWRDAEIDYWKQVAEGGDPALLRKARDARQAELQEMFRFVAHANVGTESVEDADIARLNDIGKQPWTRHFDNSIGISEAETRQLARVETAPLPVVETLLSDRPEHIQVWGDRRPPVEPDDPRNRWGFRMTLPAHAHNHGELYNLSIRRGTLNAEERFKVNEHIVQTIIMLESLPLPRGLQRIPAIAGHHHEKMNGSGYPRRVMAKDLSITERVMAIADIFEALTAADRPYKKAKTLTESLNILATMARDGHIDPALFELFLTSGVYLDYARHYLMPSQLDTVDIRKYLEIAGLPVTASA